MKTKIPKSYGNALLRNIEGIKEENVRRLTGTAAVYDKPTVLFKQDGIEYKEVIQKGALTDADFSDCCLKYNHSDSVPILARTRGGSLVTKVDDTGLNFDARLFDTSISRDLYELVRNGVITQCSFAFTISDAEYDREKRTRIIKKIDKVFDISIVDIPAYADTDVQARSAFLEAEAEKEVKCAFENAIKRKRLLLKLKLM